MVTVNDVLALALLAGLGGLIGWAVYRSVRSIADVRVREVTHDGDRMRVAAAWTNRSGGTLALESAEVTKVAGGEIEPARLAVEIDDDLRVPVEDGGELVGQIRIRRIGGGNLPPEAAYRVVLVFRSPQGAEVAETWIGR